MILERRSIVWLDGDFRRVFTVRVAYTRVRVSIMLPAPFNEKTRTALAASAKAKVN